jgi:hypothetical protein
VQKCHLRAQPPTGERRRQRNINRLGPAVMPVADPVAEIILKIKPAQLDRAEPPSARTANLSTALGKRGLERPADSPNLDGLRAVAGP